MSDQEIRQQLVEIGRRMYEKSFVAANDGNLSYRVADNHILTTPTGVSKGFMSPQQMVVVDIDGKVLNGGKPSTELLMHLFFYRERQDVNAVVHAHPIFSTGFATAGLSLEDCVAAEIITTLGSIPLAKYGTPSTPELADTLRPYVHTCDAFLLANHGVVTVGKDLDEAYYKLERVEHYAHIIFVARQLGGEKKLPEAAVEKLFSIRGTYGQSGLNPGCATCEDECLGASCLNYAEKYDPATEDHIRPIVQRIVARLRVQQA
jgi:L-fuculose-phosphate aldolase